MRLKYWISLSLVLASGLLSAQNIPNLSQTSASGTVNTTTVPPQPNVGSGLNFTKITTPLVPIDDEGTLNAAPAQNIRQIVSYVDGFSRPFQTIETNVSKTSNGQFTNLVNLSDNRVQREGTFYLPYSTVNTGLQQNAYQDQKNYYSARFPAEGYTSFSKAINTANSGNYQSESRSPGKSQVGQDRGTVTKLTTNTSSQVRIWLLEGNVLVGKNTYAANELIGKRSIAATQQGSNSALASEVIQFVDKDGRMILKMATDSTYSYVEGGVSKIGKSFLSTYYVYDDKGLLLFILPPKAVMYGEEHNWEITQDVLEGLCFQFRYDELGRAAYRRSPGEEDFTSIVYDRKGRVVMRQTPKQKAESKYEVSYFDKLDRLIGTALYEDTSPSDAWQATFDAPPILNYPTDDIRHYLGFNKEGTMPGLNAIAGHQILSYNFYDGYEQVDPNGIQYDAYVNDLQFTESVASGSLEQPVRSQRTQGLPTGSKIRLIPGPGADVHQVGEWSVDHFYYDDKGRVVNQLTRDFDNNGTLIHSNFNGAKYDFLGRALLTKSTFKNLVVSSEAFTELIQHDYEAGTGLLTRTQHRINGGSWVTLAKYQYDDLGSLKRKGIGNDAEVQDFSYDIRGSLTGINAVYAETGAKQNLSRTFGESLKYDYGFSMPRYDGKVSGMIWRGSQNANAYGYDYDRSGRLKNAEFRTFTNGIWNKNDLDYTVSNLFYDKNGNLLSMHQRGIEPGAGPETIDKLKYIYLPNSNQVKKIEDPANYYELGDFNQASGQTTDYEYDQNGSLKSDQNKGIEQIEYTYFNKPQFITFSDGSTISYSYNANGDKVQELSQKSGESPKAKDYLGAFVYQDNIFQYKYNSEGRTVFDQQLSQYKDEYFVRDHLNNVRSIVELVNRPLRAYLATFELASANLEGLLFERVDEIRDDKPGSTNSNDVKSGKLNGADPDLRVGTSLLMHVMAGDQVTMNVNNYYEGYNPENDESVPADQLLGSIIGTLTGGTGGFEGSESHNTDMVERLFTPENYMGEFQNLVDENTLPGQPKAYLNYILFDENMQVVKDFSGVFQANGNGDWQEIGTTSALTIPTNGYMAIYLSNQTNIATCNQCGDVFFDLLRVTVEKGKLLEENHYYPFGLPMAGMGSPANNNTKPNRHSYQGNENIKDLGLNLMDFHARQYDAQTGRFASVDPLATGYGQDMLSPYSAMGNAPEMSTDPDGTFVRNDNPVLADINQEGNTRMLNNSMNMLMGMGGGNGGGIKLRAGTLPGKGWNPIHYDPSVLQGMIAQADQNGGTATFDEEKWIGIILPELEFIARGKPNLLGWETIVNATFGLSSPLGQYFNDHARGVTMLYDPLYRAAEYGFTPPMGNLHTTLDAGGLLPVVGEVFDGINALYYLAEGDRTNATWSALAMAPIGGQAVTATKWGRKAYKVYEGLDKASGVVKYVGITNRKATMRWAEHIAKGGGKELLDWRIIDGATNLTKNQARIIEQTGINQAGLNNLYNKINSIAPARWHLFGVKP